MHQQYGPIIRTKPNMVHINDPEFIDKLFTGPGRIRHKTEFFCDGAPLFKDTVAFCTQDHDLHKKKRAPLSGFFSKQNVHRIEPIIRDKVGKVLNILDYHSRSGAPVKMRLLYTAANNDIITEYSFGKSWDSLEASDLNEDFFNAFHDLTKNFHVNSYHPWFFWMMLELPQKLLAGLVPAMKITKPYMEVRQHFGYWYRF